MTLPPRLLAPEFVPDLSDVPRLRAAARRRRVAQGGTLGVLVAVAVAVSSTGGSTTGLRQLEPVVAPSSAAAATATATPASVPDQGPDGPAGPGSSGTRPSPAGTAPDVAAPIAGASREIEGVPVQTDFDVRAVVVPDPGGPCVDRHRTTMTDYDVGVFEACTRTTWPERTPHRSGADLSLSYCVTLGMAQGSFDAPRFEIGSVTGIVWRFEDKGFLNTRPLTVRAGECLVWTVHWAGTGTAKGVPAWFPRDAYAVMVDVAPPTSYDGGERVWADESGRSDRLRSIGEIRVV